MKRHFFILAVLFALAVSPAAGSQLLFDTGTPPAGAGSIGVDISTYSQTAFPLVFTDTDYRIEEASVRLEGRALFTLRVSESPSLDVFPDAATLLSDGSFKRPDTWSWAAAWCPVDLSDFTMVRNRVYWFEYTSINSESGTNWLQARLIASSFTRADWNGSNWSWPAPISNPNYVPGLMLYGHAVPEPPSGLCLFCGVGCIPLAAFKRRFQS